MIMAFNLLHTLRMMGCPSHDQIKTNWPLSEEAFQLKFVNVPENPLPMQPKRTNHQEYHTDYYVSPRKFIRYINQQGFDFTYSDTFSLQFLIILTQEEGETASDLVTNIEI